MTRRVGGTRAMSDSTCEMSFPLPLFPVPSDIHPCPYPAARVLKKAGGPVSRPGHGDREVYDMLCQDNTVKELGSEVKWSQAQSLASCVMLASYVTCLNLGFHI